jgi:hypothetical protein
MFDLTISLGNILTISAFFAGIVIFIQNLKTDSRVRDSRFDTMVEQMREMKDELKKLAEVVINQAIQDSRITTVEERLTLTGKRVDDNTARLNTYIDTNIFTRMKAFEDRSEGR